MKEVEFVFRRPEHLRLRLASAAALLRDLWGDALPPGLFPWKRIAADVIDEDDRAGTRKGLAVQGDDLPVGVLEEALSYVPPDAPLWKRLPIGLATRMRTRGRAATGGAGTNDDRPVPRPDDGLHSK